MFIESVDRSHSFRLNGLSRRKKDWIGPYMTFCELPTTTVGTSFYLHSLLFRYLDWNKSWMMQIAQINDILIDLNSKWLWHFRLIHSFPAYPQTARKRWPNVGPTLFTLLGQGWLSMLGQRYKFKVSQRWPNKLAQRWLNVWISSKLGWPNIGPLLQWLLA